MLEHVVTIVLGIIHLMVILKMNTMLILRCIFDFRDCLRDKFERSKEIVKNFV